MGICHSNEVIQNNIPNDITIPLEYDDKTFTVDLIHTLRINTLSKRTIINSIKIYRDANEFNKYYFKIIYPSEYHIQYNQAGEILFIEIRLQPMDAQLWAQPSFMTREIVLRKSMKKIRLLVSSDIY